MSVQGLGFSLIEFYGEALKMPGEPFGGPYCKNQSTSCLH